MVYDIFIYVQLSQEAKIMPKTTHFLRYFVTLKKNANFHKVFSNIYKHLSINFKYYNNSMFPYLLNAFRPNEFYAK